MKYRLVVWAALLSNVALADRLDADNDRRASRTSITVTINGLTCSTSAGAGAFNAKTWSWGAANSVSSGGGGSAVGRVSFRELAVTKALDSCSPALFRAVSTGTFFRTLTLTQQDVSGTIVAQLDMKDVLVTSWGVGGNAHDPSPDEAVTFSFSEACVVSGPNRVCYDVRLGRVT